MAQNPYEYNPNGDSYNGFTGSQTGQATLNQSMNTARPAGNPFEGFLTHAMALHGYGQPGSGQSPSGQYGQMAQAPMNGFAQQGHVPPPAQGGMQGSMTQAQPFAGSMQQAHAPQAPYNGIQGSVTQAQPFSGSMSQGQPSSGSVTQGQPFTGSMTQLANQYQMHSQPGVPYGAPPMNGAPQQALMNQFQVNQQQQGLQNQFQLHNQPGAAYNGGVQGSIAQAQPFSGSMTQGRPFSGSMQQGHSPQPPVFGPPDVMPAQPPIYGRPDVMPAPARRRVGG